MYAENALEAMMQELPSLLLCCGAPARKRTTRDSEWRVREAAVSITDTWTTGQNAKEVVEEGREAELGEAMVG